MAAIILTIELLLSLAIAGIGGYFLTNTFAFSGETGRSGMNSAKLIIFGFLGILSVSAPLLFTLRAIYQQYALRSWDFSAHLTTPGIALVFCLVLLPATIIGAQGGLTFDLIREFRAPTIDEDPAKDPDGFRHALKGRAKSASFLPDRFISEITFGKIPLPSGWYGWLSLGNRVYISQDLGQLVSLDAEADSSISAKEIKHSEKSLKKIAIGSRKWFIEEVQKNGQTTVSLKKFENSDVTVAYRVTLHYPTEQAQERLKLMNIVSGIKIYSEDQHN